MTSADWFTCGGWVPRSAPPAPRVSAGPSLAARPEFAAPKMAAHEHVALCNAAYHAKRLYPGAVGEYLARDLEAFADFGYRVAGSSLIYRVIAELTGKPQAQ